VRGKSRKRGGFLASEIIVALTVLGAVLIGFALSLHAFTQFNRYQLVRQCCIAAAQAQLDSITATGKPISQQDLQRLWPKLSVSIEESAGTGQWKGMKLVQVKVSGKSFRKEVRVQLARYILTEPFLQYETRWEPVAERGQ